MNFDFDKALEAGYNEKEIVDFLQTQDTDIDFEAFKKNYHNDHALILEELKKGNKTGTISKFNEARLWLNPEDRAKLNEADFNKAKNELLEQEKITQKEEAIKELENKSTLEKIEDRALNFLGFGELYKKGANALNESLGLEKPFKYDESIQKSFNKDIKEKITQGIDFKDLSKGEKAHLSSEFHKNAEFGSNFLANAFNLFASDEFMAKAEYQRQQKRAKIANTRGRLKEEDKEFIENELGFAAKWFQSDKENLKEFKEKYKAEDMIFSEVQKAVNTLSQFHEKSLLKNLFLSDDEKAKQMQKDFLQDLYTIAELNGFDDAGLDKEGEIYFIKRDDKGKEQKYLVNTGFFDNFANTLNDSKFEIAGGLTGALAGAKKGTTPQARLINSVFGSALGSFVGAGTDMAVANAYLDRENNFKDMLDYSVQAGLLSAAGDGVMIATPYLAKKGLNALKKSKALADYSVAGIVKTLPTQNIRAAESIIDESFSAEAKEALEEAKAKFGG
ncbi:hypothetical protein DMB92_09075, partial [Campylobacter sp. MIT 99-7217]